ncbi:PspC domain-containing protein [Streptomyces sp. ISL-100]|uniref:PspC domain-containing protein n=1 Tax=Streptomyces sp. ISL-100 TaxID=2819173 RepID=UPI001BE9EE81|nr:PspC domain-containing protein [Streptomyces sp. ISL-100]MBT2396078.1 PspC domain-containing protein [Streptomyces sp. ISL-100]
MTQPYDAAASPASAGEPPPPPLPLRRSKRQKMVGGVCGGLGRHFDLDPVIFRIGLGVLAATGGLGLIFYGFAWLFIPLDGEDENEARRLLTGRVDGATLIAVLFALVGCGLFLSMLNNGSVLGFAVLLSIALAGATYWSQRRRLTDPETGPVDPVAAQAAAVAPPETQAPPVPGAPSWWRDPIVKDGTTGPVGTGYLWGPEGAVVNEAPDRDRGAAPALPPQQRRDPATRGPRGIGGRVFLLAVLAAGLGTGLSWDAQPLGTSLQIGLSCALAVFGLGITVSAFRGRTGVGTILLTLITALLLTGAAALPKQISTDWMRTDWKPASVSDVRPRYELGSGVGTLDLSGVRVPADSSVATRAEVGAGQLRVVVPKDVRVELRMQVGVGDIQLPGEKRQDFDVRTDQDRRRTLEPEPEPANGRPQSGKPAGTLQLHLEVGVGQVEVTRAAK